jgi:hypothetical protein
MTRSGTGPVHGSPSPLKAWVRTHKIPTALLSALVLILAIVIIVVVVSSSSGTTSASHPASAPQEAAVTKGAKWLTGPADKVLKAVNADLGRLSQAVRADNRDAATVAGTQLATDAKAALSGAMPPVDAKIYQSALKDLEKAGTYTASGDSRKAAPLLNAGNIDMTKITAAVNAPAAANPPAAVNDPNGQ